MKALVFGAGGQDGFYLAALLRERGIEPVGVPVQGNVRRTDVASFAAVEALVRTEQPDLVFQLAARSTTRHDALFQNHEAISTGTLNVLEAVRRHRPRARVFVPGSGVQFQNAGAPIDEDAPFAGSSPYAVARIHAVYAARYYRSLGVRTYVGYLFHHDSPRRPPTHVSRMVAEAALRIARGSSEVLEVGDVSVVKEWTFAGDTVQAMLTLVEQDDVFEAVIGSGEGHSIQEWLEQCFGLVGRDWREHVTLREDFVAEYPSLISRPTRLRSLGWAPHVTFDGLAAIMMGRPR